MSTTNPIWIGLGLNPGLRDGKPATSNLSTPVTLITKVTAVRTVSVVTYTVMLSLVAVGTRTFHNVSLCVHVISDFLPSRELQPTHCYNTYDISVK
jgi:hypothetical protein